MPDHIFISHSSSDKAVATAIAQALETRGAKCWVAPRDINPAENDWPAAIDRAITESRLMLLLLSSRTSESRHVSREVKLADEQGYPIIQLRLDDVEPVGALRFVLASSQYTDVSGLPPDEIVVTAVDAVRAADPGAFSHETSAARIEPAVRRDVANRIDTRSSSRQPSRSAQGAVIGAGGIAGVALVLFLIKVFDGGGQAVVHPDTASDSAAVPYEPSERAPKWLEFAWDERSISDRALNYRQSRVHDYMASLGTPPAEPPADWSAAFVNWAVNRAGKPGITRNDNLAWLDWGTGTDSLIEGCVIVLVPTSGGSSHSGFFLFQKDGRVFVLGGNSNNEVKIVGLPVERVRGCRWPP